MGRWSMTESGGCDDRGDTYPSIKRSLPLLVASASSKLGAWVARVWSNDVIDETCDASVMGA